MTVKVEGSRIYIRKLTEKDATERYTGWLNDKMINRYLESRFRMYTPEDVKDYINTMNNGEANCLFGIFDKAGHQHIGNIKIGDIHPGYKYGDIGLIIGEKAWWSKGIATEAIGLTVDYAFDALLLNKVTAGMYANNVGSFKAFLKNGFREVGIFKKHVLYEGEFVDVIKVEKLREEH